MIEVGNIVTLDNGTEYLLLEELTKEDTRYIYAVRVLEDETMKYVNGNPVELQPVDPAKFKDKGGKVRAEGVNHAAVRHTGHGRRRHLEEVFQKRLHAEIGQSGTEEHRAESAVFHFLQVQLPPGGKQLHIVNELPVLGLRIQKLGHPAVI